MGKCFLGVGFGALMSLAYFVSEFTSYGDHWANCLLDAMEWLFIGVFLTVCAMTAYALWRAWEYLKERRR